MTQSPHSKKFHRALANRFSIRAHLFFLLLADAVFGAGMNRAFYHFGLLSMVQRNLLVMPLSYAFFFFLMKVWVEQMASEVSHDSLLIEARDAGLDAPELDLISRAVPPVPKRTRGSVMDWLNAFDTGIDLDLGEGLMLFLGIILVLALVFGAILWFASEGPVILADAALDAALSASLVRASRKIVMEAWHAKVFARTWLVFALVLAVSTAILVFAESSCPGRARLSQVLQQCWVR